MTLSDIHTYRQVIGCLMQKPLLLTEYQDIQSSDFDIKIPRYIFAIIYNMFKQGAMQLTPIEVDLEIENHEAVSVYYKKEKGLDFLTESYELASLNNFEYYYKKLKKLSLLRALKKNNYDISLYYREDFDSLEEEEKAAQRFEDSSIDDILMAVESKYNQIKADFINGGKHTGNASAGLNDLVLELMKNPEIGPSLCGEYFSTACRGARLGKYYLRSAASGTGKTRLAVFDACKIAFPIRYSHEQGTFIAEMIDDTTIREAEKTLIITTEMGKDEIQTIVLAYLSGVNESHILTGRYDLNEIDRVFYAAQIVEKYQEYFYIEEISDPNLTNVEATIKRYATIEGVQYVFYDYIFSSPSLVAQFANSKLREDVVLMMLSNQLKQLAKDYNIFISSSTQVNANAMLEEGFKNESCIRGSRAIVDKADMGCIISRVDDKEYTSVSGQLSRAIQEGRVDDYGLRPTHVIDIYKMRRGQYKNVRIWCKIDLGTGRRLDLFMTRLDNEPIGKDEIVSLYASSNEMVYDWTSEYVPLDERK